MIRLGKLIAGLALAIGLVGSALGQTTTVQTLPSVRVTTNASGAIASTDVFQSVWPAQANRVNCGMQNNSSNTMWVFFGAGTPTKNTSVVLAPGQYLNCSTSGIVTSSAVQITGTSGGVFYAALDGAPIVAAPTTVTAVSGGGVATSIQGDVAAGGTDAGNPVKVGCVARTTSIPSFSPSQRTNCNADIYGNIRIGLTGPSAAPSDTLAVTTLPISQTTANSSGVGPLAVLSYGWNSTNVIPLRATIDGQWVNPRLQTTSSAFELGFSCANSVPISVTAGNTTQLVALVAAQTIRVCGFSVSASVAGTFQFVYGTGVNCASGTTNLTGAMPLPTNGNSTASSANGSLFRSASANAICLSAVTGNMTGYLTYAQF